MRSDSWAGRLSDEQQETAYNIALKHRPRHAAIHEIAESFEIPPPTRSAFYRWFSCVEKDSWRWRVKHAVSVARTMQSALPDDADAAYRNALIAVGVDACVGHDPQIAVAIGRTVAALNRDHEDRLRAQIETLKTRILDLQKNSQTKHVPVDPAQLAAEIDAVLGRRHS